MNSVWVTAPLLPRVTACLGARGSKKKSCIDRSLLLKVTFIRFQVCLVNICSFQAVGLFDTHQYVCPRLFDFLHRLR